MEENFESNKVVVDLEGTGGKDEFVRVLVSEGEKHASFVKFELTSVKKFNEPEKKEAKIIASLQIEGELFEGNPALVLLFLTPVVTKAREGSKNSNSKLYDLLVKLNLLEEFSISNGTAGGFNFKQLKDWLENTLTNKTVRVLVENTKSEKPYSVVKKVYGLKAVGDSPVSTEGDVREIK